MSNYVYGMGALQDALRDLSEPLPKRVLTAAVKPAAKIVWNAARANAPYDTGALESGIILRGERSKKKLKKVYQTVMDPRMNSIFQKPYAGGTKTAYYPASQEFGAKRKNNGPMICPAQHFQRDALMDNKGLVQSTIITKFTGEIRKFKLKNKL